jgi:hypothetical protein
MHGILAVIFLIVAAQTTVACECTHLSFDQEVEKSASIFHGRVISANNYIFEIEIIKVWKGDFPKATFNLIQGHTSCHKRRFELNKEYLFYLGTDHAVSSCSRTAEYKRTIDPELLDLQLKGIGDKSAIESNIITDRELLFLDSFLDSAGQLNNKKVMFALEDTWVEKWTFLFSLRWFGSQIKAVHWDTAKNNGSMLMWSGWKWGKSFRKLKRKEKRGMHLTHVPRCAS